MSTVPIFPLKTMRSWPKHATAKVVSYVGVGLALSTHYKTDAHFAAYSAEETPYRLCLEAFSTAPGGVAMVLAIFDVDAPGHGGALGATDDWWCNELPKLAALREQHPDAFVYRTRGGYRIVSRLDPISISGPADLAAWKVKYCTWVAYLRRAFAIAADHACKDATRLYRLPFVVRDGQREQRETIGDPMTLGAWRCQPTVEDETEGARLANVRPRKQAKKGVLEESPAPTIARGEGVLFHALKARGWLGRDLGGKLLARCPWADSHTTGTDYDGSTVLYPPSPGEAFGWLHCSHTHCANRQLIDVLALLTPEEISCARAAAGVPPPSSSAREEKRASTVLIRLGTDEHRVNDEVVAALATKLSDLYQRGSALIEPRFVDGRNVIRELPLARLRERISEVAEFYDVRLDKDTGALVDVSAHTPDWCARAVHARGAWEGIPALRGIVDTPVLRRDGTVVQSAGYDAASGFLYLPTCSFPRVPDAPTRAEAAASAELLLEVVKDFPFEAEAHRSAWLALVLTLFARPAFDGPSPLGAVDANTRAAGKGKLADVTAIITTGRPASKTPQPKDDDEMRKRITAVLREGERIEVIDNVTRPLDDGAFDAVLTSDVWKDRMLGKNETLSLPNLTLWLVTGNNLEFGADTARRALHVRLSTPLENPENRADFAHPDLLAWVTMQRPVLVAAALTILRSYFAAGRPHVGVKLWGSFESWSSVVAAAVVWAGLPDPQATRAELESTSDGRKAALVGLLEGWTKLSRQTEHGFTARDAIAFLYPAERLRGLTSFDDGYNALREAIEALVPTPLGKAPSPAKLGYQLRSFRGRVVRGRFLDGAEDRNGVLRWRVFESRVTAGDAGDEGDVSTLRGGDSGVTAHADAPHRGLKSAPHPPHPPHPAAFAAAEGAAE